MVSQVSDIFSVASIKVIYKTNIEKTLTKQIYAEAVKTEAEFFSLTKLLYATHK